MDRKAGCLLTPGRRLPQGRSVPSGPEDRGKGALTLIQLCNRVVLICQDGKKQSISLFLTSVLTSIFYQTYVILFLAGVEFRYMVNN